MVFSLRYVPFIKLDEDVYRPRYLDVDVDKELVKTIISFYDSITGKKVSDVDWDELRIIVGDRRFYNMIRLIMSKFYMPVYDIKTCDIPISPKLLRVQVFRYVSKRYGGFASSEMRNWIVKRIKYVFRIPKAINLDSILWCDENDMFIVKKIEDASLEKIVAEYNLYIVKTLCIYSSYIVIDLDEGCQARDVIRIISKNSRLYDLLYNIDYVKGRYIIRIEGPTTVFGKASKYGLRIAQLLLTIAPMLYSCGTNWHVSAIIKNGIDNFNVMLLSSNLKPLLPISKWLLVKPVFDGSIENRIYDILKAFGLRIIRNEEPLIVEDTVYIPTFKIFVNGKTFYVEVAGFWKREVAERKAEKLQKLSKKFRNLIIIADENLKEFLKNIKTLVIYYKLVDGVPRVSYKNVLDYITKLKINNLQES